MGNMGVARTLLDLAFVALPSSAGAATINVTTTGDTVANDGFCSLREAVNAANSNAAANDCPAGSGSGGDIISLPAGTYTLTGSATEDANLTGDLDVLNGSGAVTNDLTIAGAGDGPTGTIIDANHVDRAFDVRVDPISGMDFVVDDVLIRNGKV